MCSFFGYKQFNHLANSFGVISVLTKANGAPAFELIMSSFTADEKGKFQLKPSQFLE